MPEAGKTSGKRIWLLCLISLLASGAILLVIFALTGNMGTGSQSLAIMDAEVQYVDFFSWLKNVFAGEDSIIYSFKKGLGGTGIALFAYYLASPFNILAALFSKGQMPVFIDLLFLLKVMAASAASCFAIYRRFPKIKERTAVILAVGYSLMHWSLCQSSNIMWLDGAYMLPLILLGVYRLVRGKNIVLLSVTAGLSIIFNWYTGGFNCIIAVCWFIVEMIIFRYAGGKEKIIPCAVRFIISMLLGVLLSMVIFLPNILALREGKGSSFALSGFMGGFLANPLNIIRNNAGGVYNFYGVGEASVFAGSLASIGVVSLFRSAAFKLKEKILAAGIIIFGVLTFFLQPFYFIFTLLKEVESYQYRHEYVITLMLVFLAAWYFERFDGSRRERAKLFQNACFLAAAIVILNIAFPNDDRDIAGIITTCICLPLMGLFIFLDKETGKKRIFPAVLAVIAAAELFAGAFVTVRCYNNDFNIVSEYEAYAAEMEKFADDIKAEDGGLYRISETSHRDKSSKSACLNDGLAFNLMANTTYSSCTEYVQVQLLERLGYKSWAGVCNVVNTAILPSDSLLGVRYILSDREIEGLVPLEGEYAGRKLYENPYALPMFYTAQLKGDAGYAGNTFEYINALYSKLTGEDEKIMLPAEAEETEEGFAVSMPEGTDALYMSIDETAAVFDIYEDGNYVTEAGGWLSSGIIHIPREGESVSISIENREGAYEGEILFYAVSNENLKKAAEKIIASNGVSDAELFKTKAKINVTAEAGDVLITPVVNTPGWTVSVNGAEKETLEFAEGFIAVPLEEGANSVEMSYRLPGLTAGLILSIAALLAIIAAGFTKKKADGKII